MRAAAIAVAIGVWWTANTISHLFIHRPFFRRRAANAWFAAALTALLGFPQSLWRERHLAHHRETPYRFRCTREIALQGGVVAAAWIALASQAPAFFFAAYLPGYLAGLALCAMHGHYEHANGTISHYGRVYNLLCFNDGYHAEHHRHPSAAWWTLPRYRDLESRASEWPAPLRWMESTKTAIDAATRWCLIALERLVLRSRLLQRFVIRSHSRAFAALLASEPPPHDIAIVGGGLFPRSAIVLRALFPDARITIVDRDPTHLDAAKGVLRDSRISYLHAHVAPGADSDMLRVTCDLAVFPLSLNGDRTCIYARPPAALTIVHDWIWHATGASRIVSPLLLKRVNLVPSHGAVTR
jgi:fatty acid desaturase